MQGARILNDFIKLPLYMIIVVTASKLAYATTLQNEKEHISWVIVHIYLQLISQLLQEQNSEFTQQVNVKINKARVT